MTVAKGDTCTIDGCESPLRARGWCSKHYGRWQKYGDPTQVHQRLKGEPKAIVVFTRTIRGETVHFTADGRTFVMIQRRDRQGETVEARRYGEVYICEACKKETFSKASGRSRYQFCSHKCAGPTSGHKKLGRTRSTKPKVDHLDKLFSILVRDAGACVNCKTTDRLQCAHGFSRRYRNVRWDMRNAFCLCVRCHMFYTHRPLEWDEWLLDRWGFELYYEIRKLALDTVNKVDHFAVRDALVAETIARGITANRLPKTISGWRGFNDLDPA